MTKKRPYRVSVADSIFNVVNILFMSIICIVIVYPLYYVLVASFTEPQVVNSGKLLLYPEQLFLGGYKRIFQYAPIWTGYLNTVRYTVVGTLTSVIVTVPCAYALSRRDLFLRRQLMFLFTFTMFFTGGLIPLFLVLQRLGLYNTIGAIVLPSAVSVWNLIICRSFFEMNIPGELLDAARIDGCTDYGFFFRVVLPLSSTIIAVMVLFYSTPIWNSFMYPLVFLSDNSKMPISVILRNLIMVNHARNLTADVKEIVMQQRLAEQLKYGTIVVAALPLLVAYPFLQKYFVKGVMVGSVKG